MSVYSFIIRLASIFYLANTLSCGNSEQLTKTKEIHVEKGVKLVLTRSDIDQLTQSALAKKLKNGVYEEKIATNFQTSGNILFYPYFVSFNEARVRTKVVKFHAEPREDGTLFFQIRLKETEVAIPKLVLNKQGTNYCTNFKMPKNNEEIPLSFSMRPVKDKKTGGVLLWITEPAKVSLNSKNFLFDTPESCSSHGITAPVWKLLAPTIVKAASNYMVGKMATQFGDMFKDLVNEQSREFLKNLDFSLIAPDALQYFYDIIKKVRIIPDSVEVSREGMTYWFTLSDRSNVSLKGEFYRPREAKSRQTSNLSLATVFFTAVLKEAGKRSLLDLRVDKRTAPELKDLLVYENLVKVFPKLEAPISGKDGDLAVLIDAKDTLQVLEHDKKLFIQFKNLDIKVLVDGKTAEQAFVSGYLSLQTSVSLKANKTQIHYDLGDFKCEKIVSQDAMPHPNVEIEAVAPLVQKALRNLILHGSGGVVGKMDTLEFGKSRLLISNISMETGNLVFNFSLKS